MRNSLKNRAITDLSIPAASQGKEWQGKLEERNAKKKHICRVALYFLKPFSPSDSAS